MVVLLKDLKAIEDIDIRYFHCNHAGENESFERLCKQEGMDVKLEYTMPGTLQKNG